VHASEDYIVGYIAGAGRSGSTILDMMLGANSLAFSTGQLADLQSWINDHGHCTCGQPIDDCPFWGDILKTGRLPTYPALTAGRKAAKVGGTLRILLSGTRRDEAREIDAAWYLFETIARLSGKHLIVDSSKAALRLARLSRNRNGPRLRVIHLIRDPRGYVTSICFATRVVGPDGAVGYTGVQPKPVAVADWLAQNLLMLLLGAVVFRERYLVITYEEMTEYPERVLARLARFLGIIFDPSMLPPLERSDFHLIGGNSARLAFSALRQDDKWRRKLSPLEKLLIQATSGWLYFLLAKRAARQGRQFS
jgi:hypothetical protein